MRVAILFFSAVVLLGCVKGGYPETTLQLCLAGDDDFAVLRTMLKDAAKGSLTYGDRSGQSEAELKSLGAKEIESSFPLISISLLNRRNQGITVSNLGLPANQVMIAHYPIDGTDRTAGLLQEVRQRWKVVVLPPGKDAQPLTDCPRVALRPEQ